MKLFKPAIISFLISSLLFQGCYSFSAIKNVPLSEDNFATKTVRIHLKNGEIIHSKGDQHTLILQPPDSEAVKCKGYYLRTGKEFDGLIKKDEINLIETYNYSGSKTMPVIIFGGFILLLIGYFYLVSKSITA